MIQHHACKGLSSWIFSVESSVVLHQLFTSHAVLPHFSSKSK